MFLCCAIVSSFFGDEPDWRGHTIQLVFYHSFLLPCGPPKSPSFAIDQLSNRHAGHRALRPPFHRPLRVDRTAASFGPMALAPRSCAARGPQPSTNDSGRPRLPMISCFRCGEGGGFIGGGLGASCGVLEDSAGNRWCLPTTTLRPNDGRVSLRCTQYLRDRVNPTTGGTPHSLSWDKLASGLPNERLHKYSSAMHRSGVVINARLHCN